MNLIFTITTIVFLLTIWRPRYGLAAIILLWPSYLLRTDIANIPTTALELSLYAVTLGIVLVSLVKKTSWHWVNMTKWTWIFLGAWICAWLLATFFSPARDAAFGALKAWLVDPLIFLALLAYSIRGQRDRQTLVQAVITSGVLVAIFGLYQMVWLRDTLQQGRLSSFFHPVANYAAMYLVPIFVFNATLLRFKYLSGRIWWTTAGILLAAIILTMSYGGFFSIAAAAGFLWMMMPRGKMKWRLLFITLSVGAIIVLGLSFTKGFSERFNFTDRSSGLVRQQIWVTSWALIQQHPLLGIGPNNFEAAYREELPKHYYPPLEWLVAQPHNLYIALWLELGLLGILSFLALTIQHFSHIRRLPRTDQQGLAMALASTAALIAILVHGLVDTPYLKNDLAMVYTFFIVLPWLGSTKKE